MKEFRVIPCILPMKSDFFFFFSPSEKGNEDIKDDLRSVIWVSKQRLIREISL